VNLLNLASKRVMKEIEEELVRKLRRKEETSRRPN
jgi:hypothetical protein